MLNKDKTHCRNGHELTVETLYIVPGHSLQRQCKTCRAVHAKAHKAKKIRKVRVSKTLAERFWEKVDKTPGHGPGGECWEWTAGKFSTGYGVIKIGNTSKAASRVSYELANGEIGDNRIFVCHSCDHPSCVNPAHLFLGSAADNAADMIAKGRSNQQKKTHCPSGHEYTPENTRYTSGGKERFCFACRQKREWTRADRYPRRAEQKRLSELLNLQSGAIGLITPK